MSLRAHAHRWGTVLHATHLPSRYRSSTAQNCSKMALSLHCDFTWCDTVNRDRDCDVSLTEFHIVGAVAPSRCRFPWHSSHEQRYRPRVSSFQFLLLRFLFVISLFVALKHPHDNTQRIPVTRMKRGARWIRHPPVAGTWRWHGPDWQSHAGCWRYPPS